MFDVRANACRALRVFRPFPWLSSARRDAPRRAERHGGTLAAREATNASETTFLTRRTNSVTKHRLYILQE